MAPLFRSCSNDAGFARSEKSNQFPPPFAGPDPMPTNAKSHPYMHLRQRSRAGSLQCVKVRALM